MKHYLISHIYHLLFGVYSNSISVSHRFQDIWTLLQCASLPVALISLSFRKGHSRSFILYDYIGHAGISWCVSISYSHVPYFPWYTIYKGFNQLIFKVIQGHRHGCHSTSHLWSPVSLSLRLSVLYRFQDYLPKLERSQDDLKGHVTLNTPIRGQSIMRALTLAAIGCAKFEVVSSPVPKIWKKDLKLN